MIRRSIDVRVPPDRAFQAWTSAVHLWWPKSHTRHQGRVVLTEDRFVEVWDGGERRLGEVVTWDAPHRLVYDFFPGSSEAEPTRVTITFSALESGTRVDVLHERHLAPPARFDRSVHGFRRAWDDLIPRFVQHLEST